MPLGASAQMYWAHDLERLDGSDDRSGKPCSLESTLGAPVPSTLVLVMGSGSCAAVRAVCAGRRAGDHRPAAFMAIGSRPPAGAAFCCLISRKGAFPTAARGAASRAPSVHPCPQDHRLGVLGSVGPEISIGKQQADSHTHGHAKHARANTPRALFAAGIGCAR
jgi:hypothetical protein